MGNHLATVGTIFLLIIFFLVDCTYSFVADTQTNESNLAVFNATNKTDRYAVSTYMISWDGEIEELSTSPLWRGEPILRGSTLMLDPNANNRGVDERSPARFELFDLNTNESTFYELPNAPDALYGSPDGGIIAYNIYREGTNFIHFFDLKDESARNVKTLEGSELVVFGWLGDGRQLYFSYKREDADQYDVYAIDKDSLSVVQLTNDSEIELLYSYSPISEMGVVGLLSSIDEFNYPGNRVHLHSKSFYFANYQQAKVEPVRTDEALRSASWSSDGSLVALSFEGELCLINVATEDRNCNLSSYLPVEKHLSAFLEPVVWSSNDKKIMFQSIDQTTFCHEIMIYDLTTEELLRAKEQPCFRIKLFSVMAN